MKKCTIKNCSQGGTKNYGTTMFHQTIKSVAMLLLLLGVFGILPNSMKGQYVQQGPKLSVPGATVTSISISADGNTAIVGGFTNANLGDAWIFTRTNGIWNQQQELAPQAFAEGIGMAVAISGDGNTAIIGGELYDNMRGGLWSYHNDGFGNWFQQQNTLNFDPTVIEGSNFINANDNQGNGHIFFGCSVALSYDGNTAIVGGYQDAEAHLYTAGAVWVFTGSGGAWSHFQKYSLGNYLGAFLGISVSMSADGSAAIICGELNTYILNTGTGHFTELASPQDGYIGAGGASEDFVVGPAISISPDGNTAFIIGTPVLSSPNYGVALYVFTNNPNLGGWVQQTKLADPEIQMIDEIQGRSVALSYSGDTAIIGAAQDGTVDPFSGNYPGAVWIYTRSNGIWNTTPMIELVGSDATGNANQGTSVALSYDGNTAIEIGPTDNSGNSAIYEGAAWVFIGCGLQSPASTPDISGTDICNGNSTTLTIVNAYLNQSANWQWYTGACGLENGGSWVGSGGSITVSPNISTEYYARGEGTIDGACILPNGDCGSIYLTVNPSPAPIITVSDIVCGVSATLDAGTGNGWNYLWNAITEPNTNVQYDVTTNDPSTFNYVVTVTDANGCTGVSTPLQMSLISSVFPEGFEEIATFPPPCWSESNNTGIPWSQYPFASAYGIGIQSAMMDFWDIGFGGEEQLTSTI